MKHHVISYRKNVLYDANMPDFLKYLESEDSEQQITNQIQERIQKFNSFQIILTTSVVLTKNGNNRTLGRFYVYH